MDPYARNNQLVRSVQNLIYFHYFATLYKTQPNDSWVKKYDDYEEEGLLNKMDITKPVKK